MSCRIYTGFVAHRRFWPKAHSFRYATYYYYLDLDDLPTLNQKFKWIGYNSKRLVSLWDCDYFKNEQGSILEKAQQFLRKNGIALTNGKIFLLTTARVFGKTFNPISFYHCFDASGTLRAQIVEVTNTFKESHVYLLSEANRDPQREFFFKVPKQFYVSPFISFQAFYEFECPPPDKMLSVNIVEYEQNQKVLEAVLQGRAGEFTDWNIFKYVLQFPLMTILILPRIHWHALKLYLKGAPMFAHLSKHQTQVILGLREKLGQKIFYQYFSKFADLGLKVCYSDGKCDFLGNAQAAQQFEIQIRHPRFFKRLLLLNDISLGESYMDGDYDMENLAEFISVLLKSFRHLHTPRLIKVLGNLKGFWEYLWHFVPRKNHVQGSKKNIQDHYDLNNQFFKLWLDDSMAYSAAYFKTLQETLAEAQKNKFALLCQKLQLKASDHLLEIGSGWGGFAIYAAQNYGCRVTSITLSKEQLQYAQASVQALGLSTQIEFKLCDYRHCEGRYDKIVSIEMLEAVGHHYFADYFQQCESLLSPGGVIVIQVITGPDQTFETYKRRCDFIQKYIFPGGTLPTIYEITKTIKQSTNLVLVSLEDIAWHYAQTLNHWKRNFSEKIPEIQKLGFDQRFIRMWYFYFCYCEAPFEIGYLGDLHLVLTHRGQDKGLYLQSAR
jgi:cyclopropane-fatty-acyl-phospholipid synthase